MGLLAVALAVMMKLEQLIGVRQNGPLFVFVWLYPACRWYRTLKAAHPTSFLRYL